MIIRAKHDGKTHPYVIVSRKLIQDNQLAYGPKCLLLLMLSYPDTWNFTEKFLAEALGEPISTTRSWLNMLKDAGYFHEDVVVNIGDTKLPVAWLITEDPVEVKNDHKSETR